MSNEQSWFLEDAIEEDTAFNDRSNLWLVGIVFGLATMSLLVFSFA